MKKTNIAILCVTGLLLLCAACGRNTDTGEQSVMQSTEDSKASAEASVETGTTESAQAVEAGTTENAPTVQVGAGGVPVVGIVTYTGGIEDESFNQSAWEGLQRLSGAVECETEFYESASEVDFEQNIDMLVEKGGTLCWGIGYDCADELLGKAGKHPEVSFAIVDYAYDEPAGNVTSVVFRAEEPSFLVGFVAGNVTKTGKVGFVGGESNAVIDQFEYGYRAGVAYAAKELGKQIEVETVYVGTFDDSYRGKELAGNLYQDGCDIVFHAAGESGIGVIEAAQETGKYVIGVDKDQSYLAPEHVLTSALKYVNKAVFQVSMDYLEGEQIGGRTISLGLAEGAMGVSEGHALYSDQVYEQMLELQQEIMDEKLDPPSNRAEYDAFIKSF